MDPLFNQMEWQNGFEGTLDARVVDTDTFIAMTPVPAGDFGRLVLEDTSRDNFEVIRYSSKNASGVFVEAAFGGLRDEDGTSSGIHPRGARVRGNITAQDIRELRTNMQAVENASVVGFANNALGDFIVGGTGVIAIVSGLTVSISNIEYYINGLYLTKTSVPNKVLTATKDTYCFIDTAGNITYTEVANGADAPTLPASSIFIGWVETNGSAVTAIHLRNRGTEKVGLVKRVVTGIANQGATGDTNWNPLAPFKVHMVAGYRYKVSLSVQQIGSDRNDQQTLYVFLKENNGSGGIIVRSNVCLNGSSAFREGALSSFGYYDATVTGSKTIAPIFGTNPTSGFTIFFTSPGEVSVECVGLTSESA